MAGAGEPTGGSEEVEAVDVARRWVMAVMDDADLGAAWPLTEADLRLVLAQHWVLSHEGDEVVGPPPGWDDLARGLAACPSVHPSWERFAAERIRRWRRFWPGFSAVTWGVRRAAPSARPGVWVVSFVEPRGRLDTGRPGPPLEFRHLALRRGGEGWRVAGLDGSALFRPGWPPAPA